MSPSASDAADIRSDAEVQSRVGDTGNIVFEHAAELQSVLETCDGIIRLKIPNLLRLYLNSFVAQTCVAINEIVHTGWPASEIHGNYPSFLANSGEEALSGAIKLARYTLNQRTEGASPESLRVLLIDDENRFENFASAAVQSESDDNKQIEFIPDVVQMSGTAIAAGAFREAGEQLALASELPLSSCGILVIGPHSTAATSTEFITALRQLQANGCIVIAWAACSSTVGEVSTDLSPDIVVFDESFTNRVVPFGAFAARADIYSQWTRKGMATFHSTTYQPNTISTMHFLKCLKERSPEFFESLQPKLKPLFLVQMMNHFTFPLLMGNCQYETDILRHRFQLWSHRRYSLHRDMSEFKTKSRKGSYLFILLAVYELPILLYYLIAGRRDWTR